MFIDSHCHLDFPELSADLPGVLARMAENQVDRALCVCVTLEDFERVLNVARSDRRLSASAGVHPDYPGHREPDVAELVRMSQSHPVVAIGETGLDYFRLTGDLEWQRERFRVHIRAARECGKPLIIHTRAAKDDTLRIMREERAVEAGGVMHCFTEDWETAAAAMDMGFHISFSGIVTFKNAQPLRDVARRVPDELLLIETDSPYLAPVPFRGKTNEPGFVRHVGEHLAQVRGQEVAHVATVTSANFHRLFKVLQD